MIIKTTNQQGKACLAILLDCTSSLEEVWCMNDSLSWFITMASESQLFPNMQSELRWLLELHRSMSLTIDQVGNLEDRLNNAVLK